MIIKPVCPHCGEVVKVNVKKVDRLEAYIKTLEENNKELRATLSLMKIGKPNHDDIVSELLRKLGL